MNLSRQTSTSDVLTLFSVGYSDGSGAERQQRRKQAVASAENKLRGGAGSVHAEGTMPVQKSAASM